MAIERWTDDKLDTLADTVDRLANQVQQLSFQMEQVGARLERTTQSLDALVNAIATDRASLTEAKPDRLPTPDPKADWSSRLTLLEGQMQHLTQRIQYLEQRERAVNTVPATPIVLIEDDDMEDTPDEILWDFMEPNSNS